MANWTFLMDEYGNLKAGKLVAIVTTLIILVVIVFGFIWEFFQIVNPAHKWIVVKWWALQEEVLDDGFYTKTPFWTDIIEVYVGQNSTDDWTNVKAFRDIVPLSKDGQKMVVDAQVEYSIINPALFKQTTGTTDPRIIETLSIIPQIRRLIYDYTAEYTWKWLIQGWERQELWQRIFDTLTTWEVTKRVCKEETKEIDEETWVEKITLAWCETVSNGKVESSTTKWVGITSVNLRKVEPNQKIIAAVEAAQQKEQEVLIAKQEAEIEKEKANKVIETKRWQTESQKLEADASAYKMKVELEQKAEWLKAEAEAMKKQAEAQRDLNSALQWSRDLIEYKRLDVEMKMAEAQLEYAKHYTGQVPNSINVIGTDEAEWMSIIMGNGIPALNVK